MKDKDICQKWTCFYSCYVY